MNRVLIIAEAGVNHNGQLGLAEKLVDVAAEAGVDYVKFQTFKADKIVSRSAKKAEYQMANMHDNDDSQYDMLKKLEMNDNMHRHLIHYCNKKGIRFLSTPFDLDSISYLESLGIRLGKIPSGELTNLPFLRKMSRSFDELILSTGMSTMKEIEEAILALKDTGFDTTKLSILHCNTEYPTPMQDVNLNAMLSIRDKFGVRIGYSDHTLGIEVPVAAVAMGAQIIEKHFTLDKNLPGPDHKASLEPSELIAMVKAIRNIEKALGDATKEPSPSEMKNMAIARKSIIALKNIRKGEVLSEENITVKRPGTGISPMKWDAVIGTKAIRDFSADELIETGS
jgi:N,N'-diacetyllegionaminate synthase